MCRFITIYIIISLPFVILGQSVDVLEKRNGFKDIKLLSPVEDYPGLEYKKEASDNLFTQDAKQYSAKKDFYEKIGSLKIFNLEVEAYRGSIYQIRVVTEKDPKLYKSLKKNFGKPQYDLRGDRYTWTAKSLVLSYTSFSKNKIEMIYRSSLMKARFKEDKEKEIEEMADDF